MAARNQTIPILTYHSLDPSGSVISVAPRTFAAHMRSLAERGFRGISLSDLLDGWDGKTQFPPRPAVLTFDDGFANLRQHAAPLLSELGFRATVFVVSERCGASNDWEEPGSAVPSLPLLSWTELAEMQAAGFEIGAHSATHPRLTKLPLAEAEDQIVQSKRTIEDRLGSEVSSFAYPFGLSQPAHREVVAKHFRAAVSVKLGHARKTDDPHQLPRLDVYYFRSPTLFRFLGTPAGDVYLTLRGFGRSLRGRTLTK